MSKKLTKLSRARPKIDSTNKQLNNSDEDFQSVIVKPSHAEKCSQKSQNTTTASSGVLQVRCGTAALQLVTAALCRGEVQLLQRLWSWRQHSGAVL